MPITRIYNTELNQGVNELNNIRQALSGKWGTDSSNNTYTGNLVHSMTAFGSSIVNTYEYDLIAIVCFTDGSFDIKPILSNETITFDKTIKLAIQFGLQQ